MMKKLTGEVGLKVVKSGAGGNFWVADLLE